MGADDIADAFGMK